MEKKLTSLVRLMKPQDDVGLSIPDIRLYQLASQLHYIADLIKNDQRSVWLDLESSQINQSLRVL